MPRPSLRARVRAWSVGLLVAAAVPAQHFAHEVDGRRLVEVQVTAHPASARPGGLGFVLVDAQNLDRERHGVRVSYRNYGWGGHVAAEHAFVLLPEERGQAVLPLPSLRYASFELTVMVDSTSYVRPMGSSSTRGRTALLVSSAPALQGRVLTLVQGLWPGERREQPAVTACDPRLVPEDWRLFTGFDLVVVDGRSQLGPRAQDALRRYVHAGGRMLAIGPGLLPAGALRELLEAVDGTDTVPCGLGAVTVTPALGEYLGRLADELSGGPDARGVWPATDALQAPQPIPGLGQPPMLAFLTVILLFALAVGPCNFYLLRRKRRPLLALVTVPALGFGTTLLMAGYAVVHDGFGVRGVVRSWSLLDQREHEVATVATRTLFAGLSTGALALGGDCLLLAPAAFGSSDRRSRHRWSYVADGDLVDGAVLPPRTQTSLVTARQGVARARLRAQLRADGDLELLTDGGVQPVGEVLLRDFGGQYWLGAAPLLQPCDDRQAAAALAALRGDLSTQEVRIAERGQVGVGTVSVDGPARGMLRTGDLPPGYYVATVAAAPWLPEHGLAVDYEVARHHVVGILAPEDLVR